MNTKRAGTGCRLATLVLLTFLTAGTTLGLPPAELTKAQAIARVRTIIRNNTRGCSINRTNSITAVRSGSGWRVTASIVMSASGRRLTERAVWTVTESRTTPRDQLTAEIAIGC